MTCMLSRVRAVGVQWKPHRICSVAFDFLKSWYSYGVIACMQFHQQHGLGYVSRDAGAEY